MSISRLAGVSAAVAVGLCAWNPAAGQQVSIGRSFQGSTYLQAGFSPPDTDGAVGPQHFVEILNGRYAVYRKTDGVLVQSRTLEQFWGDAGVVPSYFSYDPRVLYDAPSGRWFASSADNGAAGTANRFLVAVSHTSDPTQGWSAVGVAADPTAQAFADFPTMGVSDQGVYLCANMYNIAGGATTVAVLVLPKVDLLAATPTASRRTLFGGVNPTGVGYSVQPVVTLDGGGAAVSLLSAFNTPAGLFKRSQITGSVLSPGLATAGGFVGVTAYNPPPTAPQPPMPTQRPNIDTGEDNLSGSVVRQAGSLWAVQAVLFNTRAAIHWVRINDTTLAVQQQGLISDSQLYFYFPSIAVNPDGGVVIGFSGSSQTQPVSSYAVGGQTTGGVTTFAAPMLLRQGLDDYQSIDGFGRNRWGDYSATTLDPTDPSRFWTIQEFVVADNTWATQITEVILGPACPSVTATPPSQTAFAGRGAAFSAAATGTPTLTYRWRHNNVDLADGGSVVGSGTPSLSIDPLSMTDGGSYTCAVTNVCGTTVSAADLLDVVCAADWDQNHAIDPSDVAGFVSAWVSGLNNGSLATDFDRNGVLQPSDIAAFVNAWFLAVTTGGC